MHWVTCFRVFDVRVAPEVIRLAEASVIQQLHIAVQRPHVIPRATLNENVASLIQLCFDERLNRLRVTSVLSISSVGLAARSADPQQVGALSGELEELQAKVLMRKVPLDLQVKGSPLSVVEGSLPNSIFVIIKMDESARVHTISG